MRNGVAFGAISLFVLAVYPGCGDSTEGGAGGGESTQTPATGGANPGGGEVGGEQAGGAGTGTSEVTPNKCVSQCNSAADCGGEETTGPIDLDNYACENNTCVYLGCNSDEECQSVNANSRCALLGTTGVKNCLPACDAVSDCVWAGASQDEDNYTCDAGVCHYVGCHSSDECADIGDYVCVPGAFYGVAGCQPACSTAADCGDGPYDCVSGGCINMICSGKEDCEPDQVCVPG